MVPTNRARGTAKSSQRRLAGGGSSGPSIATGGSAGGGSGEPRPSSSSKSSPSGRSIVTATRSAATGRGRGRRGRLVLAQVAQLRVRSVAKRGVVVEQEDVRAAQLLQHSVELLRIV